MHSKVEMMGYLTMYKSKNRYLCRKFHFFRGGRPLSTTEITKELDDVHGDSAPSYCTVAKWITKFNDPTRGFEDALRSARPTIVLTDESIRAIEEVVIDKFLFDA